MSRIGLVGGSYTSQSRNADDQLCMNWYPEKMEDPGGKVPSALYPTPGTAPWMALSDTPVRGQIFTDARSFAVGGSIFAETTNGNKTDYAPVLPNDGLPVSMAAGPSQILIASAGAAYVFDLNALTLTPIPAATLTNVAFVGYADGFFIALIKNSHTIQSSAPLDATTWPPLSTGTVSVFVDNVLSILVDHREIWLFGITKSVVYYNSGAAPFPFDVVPGGTIEQGIIAANSPVRLDNSVFWLGGDERGSGVAWRAQGYTPTRVSNHAVEFAWQGYARIDDVVGYSYQDQGHSFWVLYFPTANKTWVYDVATGMWHERGYWNLASGTFTAHKSWNHIFAFGKHLVGDPTSNIISQMSINIFVDGDSQNPIRRVRRAPHVSTEQEWIFHHQFQVDLETGLGPQPPLTDGAGNARDPQINLRWSDDGGHVWSDLYSVGAGQAGNFITRAIWRRLGRSRDRVYEISVRDPIPWRIIDAYLTATPGFQPGERLVSQYRKSA